MNENPPLGLDRVRVEKAPGAPEEDWAVVEEPLQIVLEGEPLAVTLRTPGHDRELAAGFLLSEGLIDGPEDLEAVTVARDVFKVPHPENTVEVRLAAAAVERLPRRRARAGREFRAVSACGMCGKKTIDSLRQSLPPIVPIELDLDFLRSLPPRMREAQRLFGLTGGIHAAALFDLDGHLLRLAEDIGRHNAVDKVIGSCLLGAAGWPPRRVVLLSSGRAGFEIVQKAARAGLPALAAVGAASSLAIDLAREAGLALFSFIGPDRGNRHL